MQQVEDRRADHRQADRQPEGGEPHQHHDAQRERRRHQPGSPSSCRARRAGAAQRAPGEPRVIDDAGDGEHEVDRVEQVEAHVEVGRVLALHEAHVLPGGGQRPREQHDQRDAADQRERPLHRRPHGAIDDVEAHLLAVGEDERRRPQHHPHPAEDRDLLGPAERAIEHVAKEDLQQEAHEHRRDERDGDRVGDLAQHGAEGAERGHERRVTKAGRHGVRPRTPSGRCASPERPVMPGRSRRRRRRPHRALMRSSAPFGQSWPYLSRYFFCAYVRNALTSGVYTFLPCALEEFDDVLLLRR